MSSSNYRFRKVTAMSQDPFTQFSPLAPAPEPEPREPRFAPRAITATSVFIGSVLISFAILGMHLYAKLFTLTTTTVLIVVVIYVGLVVASLIATPYKWKTILIGSSAIGCLALMIWAWLQLPLAASALISIGLVEANVVLYLALADTRGRSDQDTRSNKEEQKSMIIKSLAISGGLLAVVCVIWLVTINIQKLSQNWFSCLLLVLFVAGSIAVVVVFRRLMLEIDRLRVQTKADLITLQKTIYAEMDDDTRRIGPFVDQKINERFTRQ